MIHTKRFVTRMDTLKVSELSRPHKTSYKVRYINRDERRIGNETVLDSATFRKGFDRTGRQRPGGGDRWDGSRGHGIRKRNGTLVRWRRPFDNIPPLFLFGRWGNKSRLRGIKIGRVV